MSDSLLLSSSMWMDLASSSNNSKAFKSSYSSSNLSLLALISESISKICSRQFENPGSKRRTEKMLYASTKKSSSKRVKKAGEKKVSSTLKKLNEELLTDIPDGGRSLEETSEGASNFLQRLSERIDNAESKNEEAFRGPIFSYFNFGKSVYKRYKELKPSYGKDGSQALKKRLGRPIFQNLKKEKREVQAVIRWQESFFFM